MENQNIEWGDPIFGDVPDRHKIWYLDASGTYWNGNKGKWYVRGLAKETKQIVKTTRDGSKTSETITVLKADNFQDEMIKQKQFIKDSMKPGEECVVTNGNAFDLMRGFETKVRYKFQGQEFVKIVKLF